MIDTKGVGSHHSSCATESEGLTEEDAMKRTVTARPRIEAELAAVRAAGQAVEAFEIGNELDLYCNDADNPTGAEWAKHQWKWFLSDAQVQTFVRGYAPFLAASVSTA
jgi:hypothetical protein